MYVGELAEVFVGDTCVDNAEAVGGDMYTGGDVHCAGLDDGAGLDGDGGGWLLRGAEQDGDLVVGDLATIV